MGPGMWCVEVVMYPLLELRRGWGHSMVRAPELSFGRSIEKSSHGGGKVSELQGLPPIASVSAANPERSKPRPIAI